MTGASIERCSWSSDGHVCHYPGVWSSSTRGGGPWFCTAHARCSDMTEGAKIVTESRERCGDNPDYSVDAMRARYNETRIGKSARELKADMLLAQRFPHGVPQRYAWAHRIIARKDAGIPVPFIALENAYDIVKTDTTENPNAFE